MTDNEFEKIVRIMKLFTLETRVEIDFYLTQNNNCDLKHQSFDTVFFRLQGIILNHINKISINETPQPSRQSS